MSMKYVSIRVHACPEGDLTNTERKKRPQLPSTNMGEAKPDGPGTVLDKSDCDCHPRQQIHVAHICQILTGNGFHRHGPDARNPHFPECKLDRLEKQITPISFPRRTKDKDLLMYSHA